MRYKTPCSTLQHIATHCNDVLSWNNLRQIRSLCPCVATHCNTIQNTLQHTATHCNDVLSWDDLRQIRWIYSCIVCARGRLLLFVLALCHMGAHGAFSMYFTTSVHMSAFIYKYLRQIPWCQVLSWDYVHQKNVLLYYMCAHGGLFYALAPDYLALSAAMRLLASDAWLLY